MRDLSREHRVPLPAQAVNILRDLPRFHRCDFVFTTNGRTPICGFNHPKGKIEQAIGADDWVLHDLRRTLATGLQRLGVQLPVTEAVLNHISGSRSGIVGVYQRHNYSEEKIAAMNAYADWLAALVGENVVPLRA